MSRKISDRRSEYHGINYTRKVWVDTKTGEFRITMPEMDGLPREVRALTLKEAEKEEKKILDGFIPLKWTSSKVIMVIFKKPTDNSDFCSVDGFTIDTFNGFGYNLQAAVLEEKTASGKDGQLYEYSIIDSPLPGTVDYPHARVTVRPNGIIPYDEKVISMLCDIIRKTQLLSDSLDQLLDCDCVALNAAEYDFSKMIAGPES